MGQKQNIIKVSSNMIDVELSDLIDYELLSKLDSIQTQNIHKSYSEIYTGGITALSNENRRLNPDWMSQSANSFREILYSLQRVEKKELQLVLTEYFRKGLIKEDAEKYKGYLSELYRLFTDLTHHFSGVANLNETAYEIGEGFVIKAGELEYEPYLDIIQLYKKYLKQLVITAIEIHRKIDNYVAKNKKDVATIKVFVNNSYDAKSYFFSKIDGDWLKWLWTKSFFANLKKLKIDSEGRHNVYPELEYIRRMAEVEPETITNLILSIPISTDNSTIIYDFIHTLESLSANQIKRIVNKINNEKWISLIKASHISGYEFKDIVSKLISEGDSLSVLETAKSLLTSKTKESFSQKYSLYHNESPFIISYILECGIFEAINNIEDDLAEEALKIFCRILSDIIHLGTDSKKEMYDYADIFGLYDIDIFSLELDKVAKGRSYKKDFLGFIATLKTLIERIFKAKRNISQIRKLFIEIKSLPISNFTKRMNLFAIAQCSKYLKKETRDEIFKLFENEHSYDIGGYAEYQKALKECFPYLSQKDQKKYIQNVFLYFSKKIETNPDEKWLGHIAWEILSCLFDFLTEKDHRKVEKVFGQECNKNYIPMPQVGQMRAGTVSHKPPVDVAQYTVIDIINNLKTEWRPEILKEKYKYDDFLNPRGAKGLSYSLSADVKLRIDEYLVNINEFINENIDPDYLCGILRGFEEMMKAGYSLKLKQIRTLLIFFNNIANNKNIFTNPEFQQQDSYLRSRWREINIVSTDILQRIFIQKNFKVDIINRYKEILKKLFLYWFSFPDSDRIHKESPQDLHGTAINSVRGRAFEVFVEYIRKSKALSEDIKYLFNKCLEDATLYMKFLIGRYLSTFYYLESNFVIELLPKIFALNNPRIFKAAFSGYLAQNLYIDLFNHMNIYYGYAICIETNEGNNTNSYYPSFDELLAGHLALAFTFANLNIKDDLFVQFWRNKNTVRHKEFISFIGKSSLNKDHISNEWLKKKNVSKTKLIKFWIWCLENVSNPDTLSGFGFWINPKQDILDDSIVVENIAATLKKSKGKINWDYGFLHRLPFFAEINGSKTFEAIEHYLLDSNGKFNPNRHKPFFYDKEIKDALKIIYQTGNKQLKQKTIDLINSLINLGSRTFWDLEEVLN